ncbi:lysophospholipid acyltransferase family protein [Chloroflexota bacterium]
MSQNQVSYASQYRYPRRRPIRFLLRQGIRLAFAVLSDLRIIGQENLPRSGPLIVVANHFHFVDPAALIRTAPWPLEILGALQMVDAPRTVTWLPGLWGAYTVRRGAASRTAMRASKAVLEQNGVLGIFPEGGSWAPSLRPARPGAAYLAAQTGAPILPIGLDGLVDLFPRLRHGRHARVTARIGKPFGPFQATGKGREKRGQLIDIGHTIMGHIAELIPPERRGVYSSDPSIRAAAEHAAIYPYDDLGG